MVKKKTFSAKFDTQVAVDAVKGVKALSTESKIHSNQYWFGKDKLLANPLIFFVRGKTESQNGGGGTYGPALRRNRPVEDGYQMA
nr:hypothetical protein [uncultured Desulfobacter sp.]